MALYEIVLRKADGSDEVRLTDRRPALRSELKVDGNSWCVVSREAAHEPIASCRFICVPSGRES